MGGAPCASGTRLGVESWQQEASVFPEAGPRQVLVGQGKPGQSLPGGELPRPFRQDDANAVAQVRHPALTQFSRLRPHQGDERALVLEHRDLSYFGGTAIGPLQILGARFLTPAQHEDLLHSAADEEEPVAIDKPQIAGPVPSVGSECLAIGLGIVEIAVRDRTPMQLDLADPLLVWLGNADLSVSERPPNAARTTRPRPVAGEQRCGLR